MWITAAIGPPWYLVSAAPTVMTYRLYELVAVLVGLPARRLHLLQGNVVLQPELDLGSQLAAPVQILPLEAQPRNGLHFCRMAWLPLFPSQDLDLPLRLVPQTGYWEQLGTLYIDDEGCAVQADPNGEVVLSVHLIDTIDDNQGRLMAPELFRRLTELAQTPTRGTGPSRPRWNRRVTFADDHVALVSTPFVHMHGASSSSSQQALGHTPQRQASHDWSRGTRIGEASHPGPLGGRLTLLQLLGWPPPFYRFGEGEADE